MTFESCGKRLSINKDLISVCSPYKDHILYDSRTLKAAKADYFHDLLFGAFHNNNENNNVKDYIQ